MQPTAVSLPGESRGQSSLAHSPWGRKESDTTEVPALVLANKPNLSHYKGFFFFFSAIQHEGSLRAIGEKHFLNDLFKKSIQM